MQLLEDFIYSEQIRNNFSLYSSKKVESLFKMDLKQEYLPENRSYFKIPYYLVPIKSTFLRYTHEYEDFLSENFFIKNNEKLYYPFFVHPSSENIFKLWIKDKFRYIDSDNSIFLATPTSSYRTLSIINVRTEKQFFAKTSIFGNVANGSRHIDWKSAEGQHFFSTCTAEASNKISNLKIFNDICATGIQGYGNIDLSKKYMITFGPKCIDIAANVIRIMPNISSQNFMCSIASFTSLQEKKSIFIKVFKKSNKQIEDFIYTDLYKTIITPFFNLYSEHGISLETHCQNTLIEISPEFKITGTVFYRDFDITSLDRARYPFIHKDKWEEYCHNRLDRTTYYSNLCAREDIYINFFSHFITNLIEPIITCAFKLNLVTAIQRKKIMNKIINDLKINFIKLIPQSSEKFEKTNSIHCYSKFFNNIDLSEIPGRIMKIKKIDLNKYNEFFTASPELPITDIWKSSNGILFSTCNKTLRSLYQEKELSQ